MIRYSPLVGKRMDVLYRIGANHLLASRLLLADSGESIFAEQRFDQSGSVKTFHFKIPYHCICRLSEINPDATPTLT